MDRIELRSNQSRYAQDECAGTQCADAGTLTERMDVLAQSAQSALDRLKEVQARVTGVRRDEIKGDRLTCPAPPAALPHSLMQAEGVVSRLHDTLAEIERVL